LTREKKKRRRLPGIGRMFLPVWGAKKGGSGQGGKKDRAQKGGDVNTESPCKVAKDTEEGLRGRKSKSRESGKERKSAITRRFVGGGGEKCRAAKGTASQA